MIINFVEFVEDNENEGESWRFWLQQDGNVDQLHVLNILLEDNEDYTLNLEKSISEADVDALVDNTRRGYMAFENKVSGFFVLPDPPDAFGKHFCDLYKGRIKRYFK